MQIMCIRPIKETKEYPAGISISCIADSPLVVERNKYLFVKSNGIDEKYGIIITKEDLELLKKYGIEE